MNRLVVVLIDLVITIPLCWLFRFLFGLCNPPAAAGGTDVRLPTAASCASAAAAAAADLLRELRPWFRRMRSSYRMFALILASVANISLVVAVCTGSILCIFLSEQLGNPYRTAWEQVRFALYQVMMSPILFALSVWLTDRLIDVIVDALDPDVYSADVSSAFPGSYILPGWHKMPWLPLFIEIFAIVNLFGGRSQGGLSEGFRWMVCTWLIASLYLAILFFGIRLKMQFEAQGDCCCSERLQSLGLDPNPNWHCRVCKMHNWPELSGKSFWKRELMRCLLLLLLLETVVLVCALVYQLLQWKGKYISIVIMVAFFILQAGLYLMDRSACFYLTCTRCCGFLPGCNNALACLQRWNVLQGGAPHYRSSCSKNGHCLMIALFGICTLTFVCCLERWELPPPKPILNPLQHTPVGGQCPGSVVVSGLDVQRGEPWRFSLQRAETRTKGFVIYKHEAYYLHQSITGWTITHGEDAKAVVRSNASCPDEISGDWREPDGRGESLPHDVRIAPSPRDPVCRLQWRPRPYSGRQVYSNESLSVLDLALFSQLPYFHKENVEGELYDRVTHTPLKDWKLLHTDENKANLGLWLVLQSNKSRMRVVAIRGTQSNADILADIAIFAPIALLQAINKFIPLLTIIPKRLVQVGISLPRDLGLVWRFRRLFDALDSLVRELVKQDAADGFRTVVVGHSLGGALAAMAASKYDIQGVAFSPPGLYYSGAWFGVSEDVLKKKMVIVKPDKDFVPKIDKQVGNIEQVQCRSNDPVSCHGLPQTICYLNRVCGDPRMRDFRLADDCSILPADKTTPTLSTTGAKQGLKFENHRSFLK
mmetsp:Transcript_82333/g.142741  ORF Transcript_82333/g.142741 Transcript_82333/m.142741 type:complete len:822 (-) Transcript_82333:44-2509(-)